MKAAGRFGPDTPMWPSESAAEFEPNGEAS